ncbi:hypothetical protein F5884DRAFT_522740 [Xylogone sp. PMI_703]|nr:hypothetical protein F5884DRAFT_522740 [Xylogone sp. PMI_703]
MAPVDQTIQRRAASLALWYHSREYDKPRRNGRDDEDGNEEDRHDGHHGRGSGEDYDGDHGDRNGVDVEDDKHFDDYDDENPYIASYASRRLASQMETATALSGLASSISTIASPTLSSATPMSPSKVASSRSIPAITSVPPRLLESAGVYSYTGSPTSKPNFHKHHDHNSDSSAVTAVLITLGSISAFILLTAIVYIVFRARSRSKGPIFPWKRDRPSRISPEPPTYDDIYPKEAKNVPTQPQFRGYYAPEALPEMSKPGAAVLPLRSSVDRQERTREASLNYPARFNFDSIATPVVEQATVQTFYHPFDTLRSQNSQQSSSAPYITSLSSQTSDAYDPAQREVNRVSDLSYMSSGFGDAQILVPGTGRSKVKPPALDQASRRPSRVASSQISRFSWVTNPQARGDRDTVYTSTSIESAPRFRSINSWVAQQTKRMDKRRDSGWKTPRVPSIPVNVSHQRILSDDPAFQQHPGDEIRISKGSRIPSEILDKRTGVNPLP